jgi:hypothetical protein
MENLEVQSNISYVNLEIKHLHQQVAELQKIHAEAESSLQKTQQMYKQVIHEDEMEYNRLQTILMERNLSISQIVQFTESTLLENQQYASHLDHMGNTDPFGALSVPTKSKGKNIHNKKGGIKQQQQQHQQQQALLTATVATDVLESTTNGKPKRGANAQAVIAELNTIQNKRPQRSTANPAFSSSAHQNNNDTASLDNASDTTSIAAKTSSAVGKRKLDSINQANNILSLSQNSNDAPQPNVNQAPANKRRR